MSVASSFIESGRYKKIILIGADKMSSIIDYSDRNTCIIFGDGAGAVLLEPNKEGLGLQDEFLRSDGVGREFLRIEAGGSQSPVSKENIDLKKHFLFQDGKNVFKYAVSNMAEASYKIMERNNLTNEDVDYLVPHQANKRIIDATARRMGICDSKVLIKSFLSSMLALAVTIITFEPFLVAFFIIAFALSTIRPIGVAV